ncbi:MAG: thioredoxin domain-containing protein [Candidatus Thorarchaeota archaeon]|nr:MAG: thioredoxin domain-containing protein [Candidatus Thorarchaeota archaeon]
MTSPEKNRERNRLAGERSPYLLQHAENPVDWYAWSDEAFEKARSEQKPVFLSVGYSTCHWCHVMAHESFEDEKVAELMNRTFVNIKVDREERPDIDGVYMQIAQMMTGRGGWPLTIIMTPDKKPFFAGTYIPKTTRYNTIGLLDLIPRIAELWNEDRNNIDEVTKRIENALQDTSAQKGNSDLSENDIMATFTEMSQRFDDKHGGFGNAPKFPSPHNLLLLLRYWKRTGDARALHMVEKTLTEMKKGGIFDQIGYGFHRYSTDSHWLLPHFEKMLYDQASLMTAYTEAYQASKNPFFAKVVREIHEYVTRDLMSPEGAFYSAEDADSEGVEGKFYVWSQYEIKSILTEEESAVFFRYYNVKPEGNFTEEATREKTGLNILHVTSRSGELAESPSPGSKTTKTLLERGRQKLFDVREKRIRPHRDEKVLTDWNGYMISALAKAGAALNDAKMVSTAEHALTFLLQTLLNRKELYHRYAHGEVAYRAFLDDYAYLIMGLLDMYEATFNPMYLEQARELSKDMLRYFWDTKNGGLFFTGSYSEELLTRRKEAYDGAMPSGNSIAMLNLVRLAKLLGDDEFEEHANAIGKAFSNEISQTHSAHSMMLVALDFILGPSFEIVIAGNPESEDTQSMIRALRQRFLPREVTLLRGTEIQAKALTRLAPFTQFHSPLRGRATAHVCVDSSCKLPTNTIEQMLELLGED